MRSIFFFDTMLMPKIITFVYWFALLGIFVASITAVFAAEEGLFYGVLAGLALLVFGTIGTRLWCELFIVLFKINENIQKIADKT